MGIKCPSIQNIYGIPLTFTFFVYRLQVAKTFFLMVISVLVCVGFYQIYIDFDNSTGKFYVTKITVSRIYSLCNENYVVPDIPFNVTKITVTVPDNSHTGIPKLRGRIQRE